MRKNKQKKTRLLTAVIIPLIIVAVLLIFFTALNNLSLGQSEKGREHLETALRRAAVACYAAEGVYPPDVAYMEEHYGIQIDDDKYSVFYEIFADNIMPDITVLEK